MAKYVAKKVGEAPLWYAIVLMVVGILLIIGGSSAAESISKWMITVIGIVLAVFGILSMLGGLIGTGIVIVAFGALMITFAWLFYWLAFLILGISLLAYGIRGIAYHSGWILTNIVDLIIGVAIISLSLGFRFNWASTIIEIIYIASGALMFVDGLLILVRK